MEGFEMPREEAQVTNSCDTDAPVGGACLESAAAVKLQKVYRSYRTRRRLADSAVVAEELWWQAIDYSRLNHRTISFFNMQESAASRWNRISLNASRVGKGLAMDVKTQKLAFQLWIEAIDPRHRNGHVLHLYYEEWCKADSRQPFFYWLDVGDGKELDLKECPKSKLREQCIKYRTRCRLADSAVVAKELWWQAIDYARLNHRTISFFNMQESAAARWNRISLNASRVGKGLAMDVKAQKLAFQHWIEAIDPKHRYGHALHFYYKEWCKADSGQPFFYWLDVGDGKELDLKECPKSKLREQRIKYLGPQEREHYEYIISEGKIFHKQTGDLLDTTPRAKWIFVMSTSKRLYAGEKRKGTFHHSSFLAGGATVAAGRLMAEHGILKSISPYSGHYRPSEESFKSFLSFLNDNGVNLDEVQINTYDDGKYNGSGRMIDLIRSPEPPKLKIKEDPISELPEVKQAEKKGEYKRALSGGLQSPRAEVPKTAILQRINSKKAAKSYQLGHQISLKWSTGAGPRIGCVADYPLEVREQALEFVNLSPRTPRAPTCWRTSGLASPAAQPTQDFPGGDGTSH